MRLVRRVRSLTSVARSRVSRRRSSSATLGGLTIEHTRGSPRRQARSVRNSVWPSIVSLFARRLRRGIATEAASTTWLSMPLASSTRCSQKPSSPASWMLTTFTGRPSRLSAFALSSPSSFSRPALSPPSNQRFENFSLPGISHVASHFEGLSSKDTATTPSSPRMAAGFGDD